MLHGDLDNKPSPRLVVVFEGAIGILSRENKKHFDKAVSKDRWWDAINCFELNDLTVRKLIDLTWRENFNVNVVTWMGKDAAMAIQELMDEENIPVRGCFASTPTRLARDLSYNPDILAVYDPDPDHRFTFGSKGIVLIDPLQLGRF